MNNILVSIIIPCYNQGKFIDEAVESVLSQTFQDFEIIIINDGSTDEFTNEFLKTYSRPKTTIITTKNNGVSTARNIGIKAAKGKYILPLDADDRILPSYIEKAVKVIESNEKIGIVYCEAEFFGAKTGKWILENYNFPGILSHSYIFCTGLFKKSAWEKVDGYKSEMIKALEDYEFWLSLIEIGEEVYQIPEVLFQYRQHNVVTRSTITKSRVEQYILYIQIIDLHYDMYIKNILYISIPLKIIVTIIAFKKFLQKLKVLLLK